MSKKTGIQAITEAVFTGDGFVTYPKDKSELALFGMYLLTADIGYFPVSWPKDLRLLELIKTPYIERVAHVGQLMAMAWERVRDQGGFVFPEKGI